MMFHSVKCIFRVSNKLLLNKPRCRLPNHKKLVCFVTTRAGFDDYEKERAEWDVKIPEYYNFASDVLDKWAEKEKLSQRDSSIPAFWFVYQDGQQVKMNYQEFQVETKRVANLFEAGCGVKRGDDVIVMLPKIPEFWTINVAAIRVGFSLSPASMMLTVKDLIHRFKALSPSCIVAHHSVVDIIDEAHKAAPCLKTKILVPSRTTRKKNGWLDFDDLKRDATPDHKCVNTRSDDTLMVFFTSGTTGQPKMVEHSHSSYPIGLADAGKYLFDLNSNNILWNMSDTGWAKTAYGCIFGPWSRGACSFVHEMPRFCSTTTLQVLCQYPIDTLCAPPMGYKLMVQEDLKSYKFKSLSHCVSGGEPVNPEVIKIWKEGTGIHLYEAYGQTEMVVAVATYKCLEYRPGSMGKPSPGMDVVILDENENELGPGKQGEIALKRGENGKIHGLFKGYKNDPDQTKFRLTGKYYHTGDLAYYDADGYLWFVGRNDDLINSAGYRIGPVEVESALMEHPAVVEVAVTSSPDPDRGEVVKAFVVIKDTYSDVAEAQLTKELQEHTKSLTAPYKYPRKIEFMKELPKTTSGKIRRVSLRDKEWNKK